MKYMCLINLGPAARDWQSLPKDEQTKVAQAWQEFNKIPGVTPGNQLQPPETATTVRVQDGKTLTTDGPFAETREQLGGYYLVDAKDLDTALGLAARIPGAKTGSIEVRPIMIYNN